jgi:hypothetical protein
VVGATVESSYFLGNCWFAQFNELEQLDPQSVTFHFPVEAISSPGFQGNYSTGLLKKQ